MISEILTTKQLGIFLNYAYETHIYSNYYKKHNFDFKWDDINIWQRIITFERIRRFKGDVGQCLSNLKIISPQGMLWFYKMTSGTFIIVTESRNIDSEDIGLTKCLVKIQNSRINGNHHTYLKVAKLDLPYIPNVKKEDLIKLIKL